MKSIALFLMMTMLAIPGLAQEKGSKPEINVIYGDHHIFTVETPEGWVNDKETAHSINIASFFYSNGDLAKKKKSYMYAMGYDKPPQGEDLKSFIDSDLKSFRNKYPKLRIKKIIVKPSGGISNAVMYSFDNLRDRFKEETLYMETDSSILVCSFAAFTEQEYAHYQPIFDKFIGSFKYMGNDPGPFLKWQESRK